jgi:hypothetical protein
MHEHHTVLRVTSMAPLKLTSVAVYTVEDYVYADVYHVLINARQ